MAALRAHVVEERPGRASADGADGIAWSPDGAVLASAHHDGTFRLWDTRPTLAPRCPREG